MWVTNGGGGGLGNAAPILELYRFGCKEIREGIGLHTRYAKVSHEMVCSIAGGAVLAQVSLEGSRS